MKITCPFPFNDVVLSDSDLEKYDELIPREYCTDIAQKITNKNIVAQLEKILNSIHVSNVSVITSNDFGEECKYLIINYDHPAQMFNMSLFDDDVLCLAICPDSITD